ncbi:hotdog fold thioesterase [Solitalea koreensis]|uniref:1,4-dihydroxy-2-naphthoyl-CoA hydrolase n=1 Tax=Solitalea koreensis TaxID=543615 RepID=A0A521BXG0_9SPHI|nr:hotdog fold thioesterase [Solitalea koreensis]SMO51856.1 1,4-dihydroxy-2-naphthoyl-CoA hydrolase [Solitalea koreensis]
MIWHQAFTIDDINNRYNDKNHIGALIGIEFTEIGPDFLKATMPVDERTHQPYGLLHGGASVVLAETLGSVASALCVDHEKFNCVGLEVNANHIRAVRNGQITGICTPLQIGSTIHVWEIKMYTDSGKLNCSSRLTVMVIPKGRV